MLNMNGPVKMASYDMAGKTAVVTGGTKGIGKAIALAFGQCGANVVVAGRHEDECTAVAEAITSAGGHGKGIRTDVRNIDEINALIAGSSKLETWGISASTVVFSLPFQLVPVFSAWYSA